MTIPVKRIIYFFKKIKHWFMASYPLSKYHFTVEWGGAEISFTEVSGLSFEFAVIEHRDGNSPLQSSIKMPGLKKYSNIILKRPLRKKDNDFFNWINTIQLDTVERRDIIISLLNEAHEPIVSWKVNNGWPCKYEVAALNATSNEVLFETLEITHEGLSIVS